MEAASDTENLRSSPPNRYDPDHPLAGRSSHVRRVVSVSRVPQKDDGTLEYVFEIDEQEVPKTIAYLATLVVD
jgi:hypothetical protein